MNRLFIFHGFLLRALALLMEKEYFRQTRENVRFSPQDVESGRAVKFVKEKLKEDYRIKTFLASVSANFAIFALILSTIIGFIWVLLLAKLINIDESVEELEEKLSEKDLEKIVLQLRGCARNKILLKKLLVRSSSVLHTIIIEDARNIAFSAGLGHYYTIFSFITDNLGQMYLTLKNLVPTVSFEKLVNYTVKKVYKIQFKDIRKRAQMYGIEIANGDKTLSSIEEIIKNNPELEVIWNRVHGSLNGSKKTLRELLKDYAYATGDTRTAVKVNIASDIYRLVQLRAQTQKLYRQYLQKLSAAKRWTIAFADIMPFVVTWIIRVVVNRFISRKHKGLSLLINVFVSWFLQYFLECIVLKFKVRELKKFIQF